MGEDTETKQGGKNGKKDGLSGSSFFTWFMVIALLGVWTSVAVVWFDLVDYEEFLGKLGVYDADGDGDFDVEDAKILLGQFTGGIAKPETTTPAEEPGGVTKAKAKAPVKEDLKEVIKEKVVVQTREPKTQEKKEPLRDIKDKKHVETEKSKKDTGKERKDEKEHRKKRDDEPKERRRRTTSKKTSDQDREKKLDKRASKEPDNEDENK